jgi:hypothetical protein
MMGVVSIVTSIEYEPALFDLGQFVIAFGSRHSTRLPPKTTKTQASLYDVTPVKLF